MGGFNRTLPRMYENMGASSFVAITNITDLSPPHIFIYTQMAGYGSVHQHTNPTKKSAAALLTPEKPKCQLQLSITRTLLLSHFFFQGQAIKLTLGEDVPIVNKCQH